MRVVRVSPTEILLLLGLLRDSILIECESREECDHIHQELRDGKIPEKIRPLLEELPHQAPVIPEVTIVGDGIIASTLRSALVEAGVRVIEDANIRVYAYDWWRPSELRRVDHEARCRKFEYIPVFLALDLGVIGPRYVPGRPGYLCLEQQLVASTSWVFSVVRDFADRESLDANPLYARFLAYLAALLIAHAIDMLVGKAVLVDFNSIYIDVVRVHSTPLCEPEEVVSGV